MTASPILLWLRRDLRLHDQPALAAALDTGRPVIPVFIHDVATPGAWSPGGASLWWMLHSLAALEADLAGRNAKLVLRRGNYEQELRALMAETGATDIYTGDASEPWARRLLDALAVTMPIHRHRTTLMFHPSEIKTAAGTPFSVFTPFSRACRAAYAPHPAIPAPERFADAPPAASESLADWDHAASEPDWAAGLQATHTPGEAGARQRLHGFLGHVGRYSDQRNIPGIPGTSMLSPHLAWGEISPGEIWREATGAGGGKGLETFQSELLWREFSAYLLYYFPALPETPMKPAYAGFPWRHDPIGLRAWQRGQTGIPIVDAGMRQLWTTGWMHNRVRMITASFLIKHLLIPWQDGEAWFWDTLVDADLASNSASWQWVAGSGADAAPFFRIFNPVLQGLKFDPDGAYVRKYVPELANMPTAHIHAPWEASISARDYPSPIVDLAFGRARALDALKTITKAAA